MSALGGGPGLTRRFAVAPLAVVVGAVALLSGACGDKQDPLKDLEGLVPEDEEITYYGHVKEILDGNCTQCHASNRSGAARNGAPPDVNLDTYEDAVANAERANTRIQSGTMPPGGSGLSDEDRAVFQAWLDGGLKEGSPSGTPPPTSPPGTPTPTPLPTSTPTATPTPTSTPTPTPTTIFDVLMSLIATPTPTATPTPDQTWPPGRPITYEDEMKAFFDQRCVSCHDSKKPEGTRGGAPVGVNFDTYEEASENAERGNARFQSDTMPLGADPDDNPNDPEEKQQFQWWLDDGLQRGPR